MRKAMQRRYGSPEVLNVEEVDIPVLGDGELLIRVHATTVTATEAMFRAGKPYATRLFNGLTRPAIATLGEEFAGEVVGLGAGAEQFGVGDRVFGSAGTKFGAASEYICVSESEALVRIPENLGFAEAAASVDGFLTAMPFLRDKGQIHEGQRVLIYGASGSVGSAAVQIAKYYGTEVTAVASGRNRDLLRSLGADHVIDYTVEDFSKLGEQYDIIFDAVGKISFSQSKPALSSSGVFLEAGMSLGVLFAALATSRTAGKKARFAATGLRNTDEKRTDLILLCRLLKNGTMKPVIDRAYALEDIRAAHSYVDTGRKRGNVVIDVAALSSIEVAP